MKIETSKNQTYTYFEDLKGGVSDTPSSRYILKIVENYKNGLLHGKVSKTLLDISRNQNHFHQHAGKKFYECDYKNGLKNGLEVYWQNKSRSYIMRNKLISTTKQLEHNYKKGVLDGKSSYYPGDGWYGNKRIAYGEFREENYKNNLLDGTSIGWGENGEKRFEVNYKNGKRNGKRITWYYNKQKDCEEVYKNDFIQGNPKYWYPNGKIKDEYIAQCEKRDLEDGGWDIKDNFMENFLNRDEYVKYEKNYEGYDRYGNGVSEDEGPWEDSEEDHLNYKSGFE